MAEGKSDSVEWRCLANNNGCESRNRSRGQKSSSNARRRVQLLI